MKIADDLENIVKRAKTLDQEALDALVDLYSSRLYGFLYRMTGNVDDAEELVQEVFVRVVRTIADYSHRGRFESWLFRIAGNLGRDHARKRSRTPTILPLTTTDAGSSHDEERDRPLPNQSASSPDKDLRVREDVDILQRGMASLSENEREVILLRHYADLSFSDIAKIMETPVGTALARAHRGLTKLREWMETQT